MNEPEIEKTLCEVQLIVFRSDLEKLYPDKTLAEIDELIAIIKRIGKR